MDARCVKAWNTCLVDLPSVDREVDGGRLEAHHAFWGLPDNPRHHCTITELVYVPSNAPDGMYLLAPRRGTHGQRRGHQPAVCFIRWLSSRT